MTPESILMLDQALRAHQDWRDASARSMPVASDPSSASPHKAESIRTTAAHRQAQEWLRQRAAPARALTPAQAAGYPNFVTDVPVQGPTDEGMRAAACWWSQNRLPQQPPCVDCSGGPIPMWAQHSLCPIRSNGSGLVGVGESISFGGARRLGFALEGAGDPDVFSLITSAQQAWILSALSTINANVQQTSGTTCATWVDPGVNLKAAVGCFQNWFNGNYVGQAGSPSTKTALRTDGTLDAATVCALVWLAAGPLAVNFPAQFPQIASSSWARCAVQTADPGTTPNSILPAPAPSPGPASATAPKGLSTGAKVAIGAGGAVVLAGLLYAVAR